MVSNVVGIQSLVDSPITALGTAEDTFTSRMLALQVELERHGLDTCIRAVWTSAGGQSISNLIWNNNDGGQFNLLALSTLSEFQQTVHASSPVGFITTMAHLVPPQRIVVSGLIVTQITPEMCKRKLSTDIRYRVR